MNATTSTQPLALRAVLSEIVDATATKAAYIVVSIPGSSYQLHLKPTGPITGGVGKRLAGTVACDARRCDVIATGGRYVEPVIGRPRRVQGTVVAADPGAGRIVVDAGGAAIPGVEWGLPIHVRLTDPRNLEALKRGGYQPGTMVSFDALEGATFTPAR